MMIQEIFKETLGKLPKTTEEWLKNTEDELERMGYRRYKQNYKSEDFAYWKTVCNDDGKKIYQIGLLFYDWRQYLHLNPNNDRIGIQYEAHLFGSGRVDLCVSDNMTLDLFEKMAGDFYSTMKKYLV